MAGGAVRGIRSKIAAGGPSPLQSPQRPRDAGSPCKPIPSPSKAGRWPPTPAGRVRPPGGAHALAQEAALVVGNWPDLLEWRLDFFGPMADTMEVLAAARALRKAAGGIHPAHAPLAPRRRRGHHAVGRRGLRSVRSRGPRWLRGPAGRGNRLRPRRPDARAPLWPASSTWAWCCRSTTSSARRRRSNCWALREAHRLGASMARSLMPQQLEGVHALLGATLQASRELPIPGGDHGDGPRRARSRGCAAGCSARR